MDLKVSPFPEEKHAESAAATLPREPKERIRKLQSEHEEQGIKRLNRGPMRINREVPQGWMDCPAFGQCIGKIIPSKVPLDESYNESVPPGKRYSSDKLIYETRKAGHDIGLVLDLTNTTRYYSAREWTKLGIKHHKIACRGRDAVPDNEAVNQFVYAVMEFLQNPENEKYILVHCTHGHNRTGFMIVHYLMRTTFTSVSQALQKFAESRPPGIYKRDYIQALYKFYHEAPQNLYKICPSIPEWKRSEDFGLSGEAVRDDDISAISHDNTENNIITNDDVLGDAIPHYQQEYLRHLCYRLLEMDVRANGQFPGSHPVSLNKENMQLLKQRYYEATWKADGTRYMMLIMRHGCYLIDRTFTFRRIQMRFPLRKKIPNGLHDMTLIDGEMVIDKIKEEISKEITLINGEMNIDKVENITYKRRYLAYDLMAINGHSIIKLPFCQRMKLLEEEIIKPRKYENNPAYRYDMEPFSVRRKEFWPLSTVEKLVKEFIPKLSHEADGLIFQGRDDTYVCRTHEGLLKWKPPKLNSVDFLFELGSENRPLLFLYQKGMKKPMHGERVKFSGKEDILSGKIIECSKDPKENCWDFLRVRHDKSTPNDINTYRKVMRSVKDNITQDVLVGEINEIVRLPMYQS